MEKLRGNAFRWVLQPQLLVAFVAACLCLGALGNIVRSAYVSPDEVGARMMPHVEGAMTDGHPNCNVKPCMALTFDDGPNPQVTPRVLDILAQEHIHATFFVMGSRAEGEGPLLRRMHQEGNEIGNHSWNHPDFTTLSPAGMEDQIRTTQNVITAAGVPAPRLLRPPYGAVNDMVKSHTNMTIVRWNIDPNDWQVQDAGKVTATVLQHARPGGIVLMHDIYPTTADSLIPTIDALKQQYQLVTVSELLNLAPGDQGQYFGR